MPQPTRKPIQDITPAMLAVPDLTGLSQHEGHKAIITNHFKVGKTFSKYDDTTPVGNVLSQDPQPGAMRPPGSRINLTLSKGLETMATPMPEPEATPTSDDINSQVRTFDVKYRIPNDGVSHRIRIDMTDRDGTRTVFDETHAAGEICRHLIEGVGRQIDIRLFDNDQLRSELNK